MRSIFIAICAIGTMVLSTACNTTKVSAGSSAPTLTHNYRPDGDTTVKIDMSQIKSDELKKVYSHINDHFEEDVERLQKWIRQPSISNSGEGIQESAEMVKGFFDELGCQQSKVYDTGISEWGLPGNPVVYAKCDEGAPKTVVIYWQYDTMPVTEPDVWKVPPFDADIIAENGFKKVLVARGAANSKGPEMSGYNALMAIRQVRGKLPVNVIFVAEGDEERMDIGLRNFVRDHQDLFNGADTMLGGGSRVVLRRLRVHPVDHQRQELGPRSGGVQHSWIEQKIRGQPGLAAHQNAGLAGVRRREHSLDQRMEGALGAADQRNFGCSEETGRGPGPQDHGNQSGSGALHRRQSV